MIGVAGESGKERQADEQAADAERKPIPLKPAKRKKRKARRIEIPNEIDPHDGPQQPPPRLNFHLRH